MAQQLNPETRESCLAFVKTDMHCAGVKWYDITSHSRDVPISDRVSTIFKAMVGDFRVVVVAGHIDFPGSIVFSCGSLLISDKKLNSTLITDAMTEAIEICKAKVVDLYTPWLSLVFGDSIERSVLDLQDTTPFDLLQTMPPGWCVWISERDDKKIRWACHDMNQVSDEVFEVNFEIFYGETALDAVFAAWNNLDPAGF